MQRIYDRQAGMGKAAVGRQPQAIVVWPPPQQTVPHFMQAQAKGCVLGVIKIRLVKSGNTSHKKPPSFI